jgi:uncharacterized protein YcsI (UPF0317 family)
MKTNRLNCSVLFELTALVQRNKAFMKKEEEMVQNAKRMNNNNNININTTGRFASNIASSNRPTYSGSAFRAESLSSSSTSSSLGISVHESEHEYMEVCMGWSLLDLNIKDMQDSVGQVSTQASKRRWRWRWRWKECICER